MSVDGNTFLSTLTGPDSFEINEIKQAMCRTNLNFPGFGQ